jgi:tetratricopeptide (TPR) repeat protein
MARRLDEERAVAGRDVERILAATPPDKWTELVEHPALRTLGAVERVGQTFTETLPRDPQNALLLAQLGISLVENLPPGTYPSAAVTQLKAYVWKDFGTVLRFLGRHQESIEALQTAESGILERYEGAGAGALTHDLAIIRFSIAVTYQEVDRFQESRELLIECREVFREHRDDQRYTLCAFAEGILLQRLRHFREAREIYLLLLASPAQIHEESLAPIHRAIGLCSVELSDFSEAETHLRRSISLNDSLGQRLESLKGQAALGCLFIRRGESARAIDHLRPVRHEFLKSSLVEEAGICGLQMVEGLLELRKGPEAERLARTIVSEFTAAGLSKRAIEALGYLTEAIAAKSATVSLAGNVREYILSLRTEPEREFVATS